MSLNMQLFLCLLMIFFQSCFMQSAWDGSLYVLFRGNWLELPN